MTDERNVQPSELLEPFACPHCGQMLAPTCHVCVACGEPVEAGAVSRAKVVLPVQPEFYSQRPVARRAQFSWPIFFAFLAGWLVIVVFASQAVHEIGARSVELAVVGLQLVCAGWVFLDASGKRIPRPWRWSVMTLFFWIVFFPWYVSRRRAPQQPCAVMEAQTSLFFRAIFWLVLVVLFLSFIAAVVKTPPH
jgi:hypothetical protein